MADPTDPPEPVAGVFRRPFTEQVAYMRRKLGNLVPTQRWDDMLGAAHDDGFMVAGAAKADLLSDFAAAVDKAIAEGKGMEAFRQDFRAIVRRNGWTGWTGEGSVKGEAWRAGVILRTNASTSYAAGRHAQLLEGAFPLWVYRHGDSKDPRPEHLSWDGWCGPPDHPFWKTHYPPSDWGCSCYVVGARSAAGARRLGGDPDKKLPANWQQRDPRTGAPVGIGRGWDYAPGGSKAIDPKTGAATTVAQLIGSMAGKIGNWDYQIAKAFMSELPKASADAIGQAYRALPSTADDARRYAQRVYEPKPDLAPLPPVRTLGQVPGDQLETIAGMVDAPIAGFDFRLTEDAIRHVLRSHGDDAAEALRGQRAVGADDFGLIPGIVSTPDAITGPSTSAIGETLVHYVKRIAGETYTATFAVNRGYRSLTLKTFYVGRGGK